jgi:RNA 2',3'-cyclic 3'-phosphodiesterase
MMLRVFFGIPIDGDLTDKLIIDTANLKNQLNENIRWVKKENWHVTVKFFAEVNAESLTVISKTAEQIAQRTKPFTLKIKKTAVFPTSRSKIIAAFVRPNRVLRAIHVVLDKSGEKMGIKRECRRYRPHITLAKFRHKPFYIEPLVYSKLTLQVRELVLYESHQTNEGSEYIPLKRFKLVE